MQGSTRGIHTACIQEIHLRGGYAAPQMQGFNFVARQDCEDGYGGVLIYVRESLCPRITRRESHDTGRVQPRTVTMRTPRGLLNVPSVYAAPRWRRANSSCLARLREDGIVLGDFNAVGTWDPVTVHSTSRPHEHILEEHILQSQYEVLNDRSVTRTSKNDPSKASAIDITAASGQWSRLSTWKADKIPTTDNHIVTTTIQLNEEIGATVENDGPLQMLTGTSAGNF